MKYEKFEDIERKWQIFWEQNQIFATINETKQKKYYVLDMFPYPSGKGLHVGHPVGYIASDVISRYKKHKDYNVLHPMGFDAFGLPAEQYAIQTGQSPQETTEQNIRTYTKQLKQLGLSFDWNRQIITSEPDYYQWTQWIFIQFFQHWYDRALQKARPIRELIKLFETEGNLNIKAECNMETILFTATEWNTFSQEKQQNILLQYRLAYLAETMVNWCPELGTVLANEEVKNGVSERGNYPVVKKEMRQWSLRITAYSDRLLENLAKLDWPQAVKEMQKNWIGKKEGVVIGFELIDVIPKKTLYIFTTRPETIWGVTYLAIDNKHPDLLDLVLQKHINLKEPEKYLMKSLEDSKTKASREKEEDINGFFTGLLAKHPFTGKEIPIWVADYVSSDFGTRSVMGVPAHDERDYTFARNHKLPIIEVLQGEKEAQLPYTGCTGSLKESSFLNGLSVEEARKKIMRVVEERKIGYKRIFLKLKDAIFSRQRYWGEPFPIYYDGKIPNVLKEKDLPLVLPKIPNYQKNYTIAPLDQLKDWKTATGKPYEINTMPAWAGSSWYFLRYISPKEQKHLINPEAQKYWKEVDLYIGGAEHTTGHLLYARFFMHFLNDIGIVDTPEPFKKLLNQGLMQNTTYYVYRVANTKNQFISYGLKEKYNTIPLHVEPRLVQDGKLDLKGFQAWKREYKDATFLLEDGVYRCGAELEKMSKSRWNVVNPDEVIKQYGADAFRMYILFLGPIEQNKTWNIQGIEGISRFLNKLWELFHDEEGKLIVQNTKPKKEEYAILHQTIQKVTIAIEKYAFNTAISSFMICVNELKQLGCKKKEILMPLTILLSPFTPHIAEELWEKMGQNPSIATATWPKYSEAYLQKNQHNYPITINGKKRAEMVFALDMEKEKIEEKVLQNEKIQKWLGNAKPTKIIFIPGKIINLII